MKIQLQEITIKELVKGYENKDEEGGVVAYADCNGKARLNIRPKYQREFVYKEKQRDEVIKTIMQNFPLNTMYWVKNTDKEAEFIYEVLDGQQRSISICEYYKGNFSVDLDSKPLNFHNLPEDKKEKFLNYKLMIYICEGSESEKLEWFRVINIAGEKLTEQELRNAVYASAWLSDAKRLFSKNNCKAVQRADKYLKGASLRQEILESALAWKVDSKEDKKICAYMAKCAKECKNADSLWAYFSAVIEWVEMKFSKYRKEMKGLEWGLLYNAYKDKDLDSKELEAHIARLMQDEEVQKKSGIYEYLLSGSEKHLNLRSFSESVKREVYETQKGKCAMCKKDFDIKEMEADHIRAWSKGGKTEKNNCQMLCRPCNRQKSAR